MNKVLRIGITCIVLLACLSCGKEAGQQSSDFEGKSLQNQLLLGRAKHTAVWTGSKMIVFGGFTRGSGASVSSFQGDYTTPNDVMEYDPQSDSWRFIHNVGTSLSGHSAIWTGSEMIVWGGLTGASGSSSATDAGIRYNPAADTWSTMSTTNSPSARFGHTAIWADPASTQTGISSPMMIIWGGFHSSNDVTPLADGARYDPGDDTWIPLSTVNAPSPRAGYSAVWTGKDMIIWGGMAYDSSGNSSLVKSGARYDPISDTWSATSVTGAPYARQNHIAAWTGTEMLIVGGFNENKYGYPLIDGARYDPASDTWRPMAYMSNRYYNNSIGGNWTGVWTGAKLLVFLDPYEYMYDPTTNTWKGIGTPFFPSDLFRWSSTALWDGTEMIMWGGQNKTGDLYNIGIRYDPNLGQWRRTAVLVK